jgi:hypothetical protein
MELIATAGYSWMMLSPQEFDPAAPTGCTGASGEPIGPG